MSLSSLGIKAFLASDKGMACAFSLIFSTTVGYGVVILAQGEPGPTANARRASQAYALTSAAAETAVIETPEGRQNVRIGSVLPGLGTITDIGARGDRWVVSTSSGQKLTLRTTKP